MSPIPAPFATGVMVGAVLTSVGALVFALCATNDFRSDETPIAPKPGAPYSYPAPRSAP